MNLFRWGSYLTDVRSGDLPHQCGLSACPCSLLSHTYRPGVFSSPSLKLLDACLDLPRGYSSRSYSVALVLFLEAAPHNKQLKREIAIFFRPVTVKVFPKHIWHCSSEQGDLILCCCYGVQCACFINCIKPLHWRRGGKKENVLCYVNKSGVKRNKYLRKKGQINSN